MKNLLLTCATLSVLTSPATAHDRHSEIRNGERHLRPKEENKQNDDANIIQRRAVEMGFFSWPVPAEKVEADQVSRPRQVSDCGGHDPEYRPAHDFSSKDDPRLRKGGQAKAFIYEWTAYGNAIEAQDCTCDALSADWEKANVSFDALVEGIENFRLYTTVPHRVRNAIKRDYDQMCDVWMLLDQG
ncbi:hypothetical protein [Tateyamaria pelophila]|uniref:hypothetical protein n=1 Tax=Tateyamaria pelophila TaxID=328415 RepID=UPI001CC09A19|nr:hypothetical protein [Tateyamaria pelophila]